MRLHDSNELINQVQFQCQYPGQTMMVSLAIMLNFESLQEAKSTGNTFTKAAESSYIPGAGCAVGNALDMLTEGVTLDDDADTIIQKMHERWRRYAGHQESYRDDVEPGLAKAAAFEQEFKERWDAWKAASSKNRSKMI